MLSKNQIKEIQSLHLKKFREQKNKFLAEGVKTIGEIIQQRPDIIESLYADNATPGWLRDLAANANIPFVSVSPDELKKLSLQSQPNSVLALCHFINFNTPALPVDPGKQFCFYLDDVRDPGNLGTIIRLADWFGMSTVYCSPECCELYNPKVIQASMGAFLRVAAITCEAAELIQHFGVKRIYGAVLNGSNIYAEELNHGLIIVGNEANGIHPENLSLVTHPLTIPRHSTGATESLNAAMAAGIIASEFFRRSLA